MPIKVTIDYDSVDAIVVAALKESRKSARSFRGPHKEDADYYRELSAAIRVVLKHYGQ
jgi:hypothetical protein